MIDDMRAHPRFIDALHQQAREFLAHFDDDPALHRTFIDVGRLVIGALALHLDATGGVTHRRLRTLAGEGRVLSAGRATALLMQLRRLRYLEPVAESAKGAAKRYLPTLRLVEGFRERIRLHLSALALVTPDIAPLIEQLGDARVFQAFVGHFGERVLAITRLRRVDITGFNVLIAHDVGVALAFVLFEKSASEAYCRLHGSPIVSVAGLAKRFGASRTQILRLLRDTENAGFIRRGPTQAALAVEPAFHDAFQTFWAIYFIALASSASPTLRAISADSGVAPSSPQRAVAVS